MAVGFWRKVKNVAQNAFQGIKNVASFVNDNIIKPILPAVKPLIQQYVPGGRIITNVLEEGSDTIDRVLPQGANTSWNDVSRNSANILSRRIQLK